MIQTLERRPQTIAPDQARQTVQPAQETAPEVKPTEALPAPADVRARLALLRQSSQRIAAIGAELLSHSTE